MCWLLWLKLQSFVEFRDATVLSMRRARALTFTQRDLSGEADDRQSGRAPCSIPLIVSSKQCRAGWSGGAGSCFTPIFSQTPWSLLRVRSSCTDWCRSWHIAAQGPQRQKSESRENKHGFWILNAYKPVHLPKSILMSEFKSLLFF